MHNAMDNISLNPNITCAFTGRRPSSLPWKYDEQSSLCLCARDSIRQLILDLYAQGYRNYIVGGAQGIDMLALEEVAALKLLYHELRLYAFRPGANQAERWPAHMQTRYQEGLAKCDGVLTLSPTCTTDAYYKRNREMVNVSTVLIAYWEGKQTGGTWYTLNYAQRKGLETHILWNL